MDISAPPTYEQHKMAVLLGLSPRTPESWPYDTIDRLIALRDAEGWEALYRELNKMMCR